MWAPKLLPFGYPFNGSAILSRNGRGPRAVKGNRAPCDVVHGSGVGGCEARQKGRPEREEIHDAIGMARRMAGLEASRGSQPPVDPVGSSSSFVDHDRVRTPTDLFSL